MVGRICAEGTISAHIPSYASVPAHELARPQAAAAVGSLSEVRGSVPLIAIRNAPVRAHRRLRPHSGGRRASGSDGVDRKRGAVARRTTCRVGNDHIVSSGARGGRRGDRVGRRGGTRDIFPVELPLIGRRNRAIRGDGEGCGVPDYNCCALGLRGNGGRLGRRGSVASGFYTMPELAARSIRRSRSLPTLTASQAPILPLALSPAPNQSARTTVVEHCDDMTS
jgi:hypothetical protein